MKGPHRGRLVDRQPQNLPLPLAGLRIVRRPRLASPLRRRLRRLLPAACGLAGLLMMVGGVTLALTRPALSAYSTGDTVHIAGVVLRATAPPQVAINDPSLRSVPGQTVTVYTGDATLVIVTRRGRVRAGAAAMVDGRRQTGACDLAPLSPDELEERCNFSAGSAHYSAVDEYRVTEGSWHRRYSDGGETVISVPSGAAVVPLPFPLGR